METEDAIDGSARKSRQPARHRVSATQAKILADIKRFATNGPIVRVYAETIGLRDDIAEAIRSGVTLEMIVQSVAIRCDVDRRSAIEGLRQSLNGLGLDLKLPRGHRPKKDSLQGDLAAATPKPNLPTPSTQGAKKEVTGDALPAPVAAPAAVGPQPPAQPAPTPAPTSSKRRLAPCEMLLIDAEVEGDSVHLDEYLYKQLARFESGIAVFLEGTESERKTMIQTVFADGHRSVPYPRSSVNGMVQGMMPDIRRNAERVWASRPQGPPSGERISMPP